MQWTVGKTLYSFMGALVVVMGVGIYSGIQASRALQLKLDEIVEVTARSLDRVGHVRYLTADLQAGARRMVISAARKDGEARPTSSRSTRRSKPPAPARRGMGLAVVADEVRNLAQRSAQAAKDTGALFEESIAKSQQGTAKVEQVAQSVVAITDGVRKVKGLVTEVSEASRQQSQGIDPVAQAIAQMEKVTQSTAASAEECAAASEELSAEVETTMAEVVRLEAMVMRTRASEVVPRVLARPAIGATDGKATTVARLPSKRKVSQPPPTDADSEIPMRNTGTYGRF